MVNHLNFHFALLISTCVQVNIIIYPGNGSKLLFLYAVCGYLFGAGIRTDGGQALMEEVGSRREQPLYTCTGAVKASVKAVTFSIDGSLALEDMKVKRIQDKDYEKKEEQPLWAMEDWRYSGNEGPTPAPLWGIVNSSF